MKTVGIKDLKNNLSAYLREVRRGEHILVTDRNEVVAELREPGSDYGVPNASTSKLEEWIEQGIVRRAPRPQRPLPEALGSRLDLPEDWVRRELDLDREDHR